MNRIELFLSDFDIAAHYERTIQAPIRDVYRVLKEGAFGRSWVVRALMRLRSLPVLFRRRTSKRNYDGVRLRDLSEGGFFILYDDPQREIVLGVVGQFWKLSGNIFTKFDPVQFREFAEAGYCKAAWNFRLEEVDPATTRLSTETRVAATDAVSRRKFKRYWKLVGPFSGLIRILMLKEIEREAVKGRT